MKKITHYIPLITIFVFVLIVFFSISNFINLGKENFVSLSVDSNMANLENLKYSFDGVSWKDFDEFEELIDYEKYKVLYVKGNIPKNSFITPMLYVEASNNYYRVYKNGEYIGASSEKQINRNSGTVWSAFEIYANENVEKEEVLVRLSANSTEDIGKINALCVGSKFYIYSKLLYSGFYTTVFSVISIALGFIIFLSTFGKRYRDMGFQYIGLFSIFVGGFWFLSVNVLAKMVFDNTYFMLTLAFICCALIPITIVKYIETLNKELRKFYDGFCLVYLAFLTLIIVFDIFDFVSIFYWIKHIMIALIFVSIHGIYVIFKNTVRLIKINDSNKVDILELYVSPIFSVVLLGLIIDVYLFSKTNFEFDFNYATNNFLIAFLIICITAFSIDLKKTNGVFVENSEKTKLNRIFINKLVFEQERLYKKDCNIGENFCNCITNFLFPIIDEYGNKIENQLNISTFEKYLISREKFKDESSSFIYMKLVDTDHYTDDTSHSIIAATGIYKEYIGTDAFTSMPQKVLADILSYMNGKFENSKNKIVSIIGDKVNQYGVIVYENIDSLSDIQRSLLESYMITTSVLIENYYLVDIAKNKQYNTVYNLNEFSELRSKETGNHIRRVSFYSGLIGKKLGFSNDDVELIQIASSMHDIGKISIPDFILNKPGKLTPDEILYMKKHSEIGYEILQSGKNKVLKAGSLIARYHHERYDGNGTYHLKGEEIPLYARIVAVVDVFDALLSARVYKKAWHVEDVISLLKEERNKQFDPNVVDVLINNIDEFFEIKNKFADE